MQRIYFDHAATTPVRSDVVAVVTEAMTHLYGNASSAHGSGQEAKKALEDARKTVASILHAEVSSIIFTGSGTESINLALQGVIHAIRKQSSRKLHIVTSAIEHKAVLETCRALYEFEGITYTVVPVDPHGRVAPDDVLRAIKPETALVSIQYANNEIGTIQPIEEITHRLKEREGVFFHVDACQAGAALPLDVKKLGVDLLTLNGSKIEGPKGVGVLYVRPGVPILSIIHGGGQERGLRSGTENVPLIVGFATALTLAQEERKKENKRQARLRDRMIAKLLQLPQAKLNGHPTERLPNNVHVSFQGIEAETLLYALSGKGIDASAGSACTSHQNTESHVLQAIGLSPAEIHGSIRLTIGRITKESYIAFVCHAISETVKTLRKLLRSH